jgi:hypothetical protein
MYSSLSRRSASMARCRFSARVCLRRGMARVRPGSSVGGAVVVTGAVGRHRLGNGMRLPG